MTGSATSGYEFIVRPYPYLRDPFRVNQGEKVGYLAEYFSIPAFGLLADKRLFSDPSLHPISSPIYIYINKDTGLKYNLEPTISASGYASGTPHYSSYILDIRNLLEDVLVLHAADSEYTSDDFFAAHMIRNRAVYNLDSTSGSGVSNLSFMHPNSASITPTAPSSTLTPAYEIELGALQLQDIDIDEIQWNPFPRPKKYSSVLDGIPAEPFFPAALPNGSLPTFTFLDQDKFGELGLDVSVSGGVLITGDGLVEDTSIKLLTGSGQEGASEGIYQDNVQWKLFPAQGEMNRYYETQHSGCITASGRQAIYEIPASLPIDSVLLLDVSEQTTSGQFIQLFPRTYHATSGIDADGVAHHGIHTVDRLLYNLYELSQGQICAGRSLLNGKKIFGHFAATDTSSRGFGIGNGLKYTNNDLIYAYGGITNPAVSFEAGSSEFEWLTTNNRFSPGTWSQLITTAFEPNRGIFGAPNSTSWDVGDINASIQDGVIFRKQYVQWGYFDQVVYPAQDRARGGDLQSAEIVYETHIYEEGDDGFGNFRWVEKSPPESPIFSTVRFNYFRDSYAVNNIFSLFFLRRINYGFVHVNGQVYFQWSDNVNPRCNKFAPVSTASRTTRLEPPTARTQRIITIGSFPSWRIELHVTTNNQVTLPEEMLVSPAASFNISISSDLPISLSDIDTFGPAVWDEFTSLNYLYISTLDGRHLFAKMNTSFEIIHINEVESSDPVYGGRLAIFDI